MCTGLTEFLYRGRLVHKFVEGMVGKVSTIALFLLLSTVVVLSAFVTAGSCQSNSEYKFGVKAGDWIKYTVKCSGDPYLWNMPLTYDSPIDVKWIRVEVLSLSDSNVTVRETIHCFDGAEHNRTIIISPAKPMYPSVRYIIPANVNIGYKLPVSLTLPDIATNEFKKVNELSINETGIRSYGGVARQVNVLKWSWLYIDFGNVRNLTETYVWDRATGFLLEKKWQSYFLGYENLTSSVSVRIVDTNLWHMEKGTQSIWNQICLWAIASCIAAFVAIATVLVRKEGQRRSEK